MKQKLARRTGANASSIVTATGTLYGDFINETYHGILRKPWATHLRDTTTTKASVAGTQSYSVTSCARINRIWDPTNRIKLTMKTLAWLRAVDPEPVQGTPVYWIPTDVTKTTQVFLLEPIPAAVVTYTLDITSPITELSADGDVPLIPDDFQDLLIDGAELRLMVKKDDPERWSLVKDRYAAGVSDLASWIAGHPDWRPTFGAMQAEFSSLGAHFPADSMVP
jgi:hypothetical protein